MFEKPSTNRKPHTTPAPPAWGKKCSMPSSTAAQHPYSVSLQSSYGSGRICHQNTPARRRMQPANHATNIHSTPSTAPQQTFLSRRLHGTGRARCQTAEAAAPPAVGDDAEAGGMPGLELGRRCLTPSISSPLTWPKHAHHASGHLDCNAAHPNILINYETRCALSRRSRVPSGSAAAAAGQQPTDRARSAVHGHAPSCHVFQTSEDIGKVRDSVRTRDAP